MNCRRMDKKYFISIQILAWFLIVCLALEFYAKLKYNRGTEKAASYSAKWELRKVTECFDLRLWEKPWERYRPGAEVNYTEGDRTYSASINSVGFRGRKFSDEPNTLQIACVGGSTTVNGPFDSHTYPALLEQFLNQKRMGKKIEVMNCGVAGMNSSNYQIILDRFLEENLTPDWVIEYNGINNICWNIFPVWKNRHTPVQKLLLRSYFVRLYCGRLFIPQEAQIRADIRDTAIFNLKRFHQFLASNNIRLSVSSFVCPSPFLVSEEELNYLDYNLRHWWKSEYISYIDFYRIIEIYNEELKLAFQNSDVDYLPLADFATFGPEAFLDICHMNPEGVEEKAFMLGKLLLPLL